MQEKKRKIKVCNAYCGIGGNRKLWKNVEVTAVENDPEIAKIYQDFFPEDKVIVTDAHQFLLEHYTEFDFIWSSPPCPSHSRTNYFLNPQGVLRYPDMGLYQEILFLEQFCICKYVVENVIPYYEPLKLPQIVGRHCFWSNFNIPKIKQPNNSIGKMCGKNQTANKKLRVERNCVDPKLGLHIFNCAFKTKQETITDVKQ